MQQLGDALRVIEGHLVGRVTGQQRSRRLLGPGRTQLMQQLGNALRVIESHVAGGPSGQITGRQLRPGRT